MSHCDPKTSDVCDLLEASRLEYFVGTRLTRKEPTALVFVLPYLRPIEILYPSKGAKDRAEESLEAVALNMPDMQIHIITSDPGHGVKAEYEEVGIRIHTASSISRQYAIIREEVFIEDGTLIDDEIVDSCQDQRCDHNHEALEFAKAVLNISID